MYSKLERKWWFAGPVTAVAALLANLLTGAAGLMQPFNSAQWLLYLLAFVAIQRSLSFAAWLLVLGVAPTVAAPERSR
ncbi:hypothetical protein [Duganella qianjiadongensis]|uniref:Uncharacterized protein n=1 Tax=Duganella qianjiadongensis TaxID=2692176 RepID=A0ABW9VK62_9BURK|nr:hypothetical protein [Duganella qianjiadongensis]MYM38012.1 hypothetical protein [Duganella qianjiadongensis]